MNNPAHHEGSEYAKAGVVVFVILCGLPALELTGFGFGIPLTLPVATAIATAGGLIGGAMICPRPLVAGLVGGVLAGPVGLLALYAYAQFREELWNAEIALVQIVASLPGFLVGVFLKKVLTKRAAEAVINKSADQPPVSS